jgi:dienelactone hydrolase
MRTLSFEDDLAQLIDQAEPSMLFEGSTPEELESWQGRFRSTLNDLLGICPERADLCLEYLVEVDCGNHTRYRIRYQTEPEVYVPAYLLVPKDIPSGERVPGLICLHGHGQFGKDSIVGIDDSPERKQEIDRLQYNFGQKFAEQGYVVLAPDLRGFGERRPDYPGPRTDHCLRDYLCATLLGTSVVALHLCDLGAALDVLQSLEYVDGERLGCAGLSLGGRMTMMISAMDHRIKIAVPSGCMSLYQERYQALYRCGAQLIPGLLLYGDTPEIFSLIAPRPMVIEWGLKDRLAPHEWAERGLTRIRRAYEAAGVPDRLFVDRFDAGHMFHMDVARDVLQKWRSGLL